MHGMLSTRQAHNRMTEAMTLPQPAWVSAAALQGALADSSQKVAACCCGSDYEKRLALATAAAKQHIALGLAPQHTRALRVLPTHGSQQQASNALVVKQTKQMANLLEQQSRQIQAQQSALERLLQEHDSAAMCHLSAVVQPAPAKSYSAPAASAPPSAAAADAEYWTGQQPVQAYKPAQAANAQHWQEQQPIMAYKPAQAASAQRWQDQQPIKAYKPAQDHASETTPSHAAVASQLAAPPPSQAGVAAMASSKQQLTTVAEPARSKQQSDTAAQLACSEVAAAQSMHWLPSSSSQSPCASVADGEMAFGKAKSASSSAAVQGTSNSLTAQPQLYKALCAAVNAVVQHAGLPHSHPAHANFQPDRNDASHAAKAVNHSSDSSAAVQQQQQQQQQQPGETSLDSHQVGSSTVPAQHSATASRESYGSQAEAMQGSIAHQAGLNAGRSPGALQTWQSHIQQAVAVLQSALQASQRPEGTTHHNRTAAQLQEAGNCSKADAVASARNSASAGGVHKEEEQTAQAQPQSKAPQHTQRDVKHSVAAQRSTGNVQSSQQGFGLHHSTSQLEPPQSGGRASVGSEDLQPEASWPQIWPLEAQHQHQAQALGSQHEGQRQVDDGPSTQHPGQRQFGAGSGSQYQQQERFQAGQSSQHQHQGQVQAGPSSQRHVQGPTLQHHKQGSAPQHHMQYTPSQRESQGAMQQHGMQGTSSQGDTQGAMQQHHMPQHHMQGQRRHVTAQRRLYKHGPMIPTKPSTGLTPARRRQRPDWDDNLTVHATPQRQTGVFDRGGGFSPRPTARELLQEALARIQSVASPRPQHAKRQRRGAAAQPEEAMQQPATAVHEGPQLPPAAIQEVGHSCAVDRLHKPTAGAARRQQHQSVQAAARQGLIKQHAFGGKPIWVQKPAQEKDDRHENLTVHQGPNAGADMAPDLEDPSKAEAWQKLTHLQQHMQGLIAAVEDQLTLTHRTENTPPAGPPSAAGVPPLGPGTDTAADQGSLPQLGLDHLSHGQAQASEAQLGHDSGSAESASRLKETLPPGTHADSHAAGTLPEGFAEDAQAAAGEVGPAAAGAVVPAAAYERASDAELCDRQQPCSADASCLEVKPHDQGMTPAPVMIAAQAVALAQQIKGRETQGALSDADVQRILAHRRAFLKHQRAFDRACIGSSQIEFDPTQVVESIADMMLDDVLQQSAAELGAACDSLAEELFDNEFAT